MSGKGGKINPEASDNLPPPYQELNPIEVNPGPSRPAYPIVLNNQVQVQPYLASTKYPQQSNPQYTQPSNQYPQQNFTPQYPYQPQPYPNNGQVYVLQNQQYQGYPYPNQQYVAQQPYPINQPTVFLVQPKENVHRTLFFVGFCCPFAWCLGCYYSLARKHPHPNSIWWERFNMWLSSIIILWLIGIIVMFSVVFNLH
ncbi:hypothetical protein HDV01_001033 [Terramyces sp. JEL0728]|nr:hypothetical protein HDV01_001033 [Terramyces sp. JEL0728]